MNKCPFVNIVTISKAMKRLHIDELLRVEYGAIIAISASGDMTWILWVKWQQ